MRGRWLASGNSRHVVGRHDTRATHEIDEIDGCCRGFVAAPRHVLVRTNEHQLARVQVSCLGLLYIENGERNTPLRSRLSDSRDANGLIEANERVSGAEGVVERASIPKPQMRRAATRDR